MSVTLNCRNDEEVKKLQISACWGHISMKFQGRKCILNEDNAVRLADYIFEVDYDVFDKSFLDQLRPYLTEKKQQVG